MARTLTHLKRWRVRSRRRLATLETGQAGREIQGPMAIAILGGLITSTLLSLIVLPALIWRFRRARS